MIHGSKPPPSIHKQFNRNGHSWNLNFLKKLQENSRIKLTLSWHAQKSTRNLVSSARLWTVLTRSKCPATYRSGDKGARPLTLLDKWGDGWQLAGFNVNTNTTNCGFHKWEKVTFPENRRFLLVLLLNLAWIITELTFAGEFLSEHFNRKLAPVSWKVYS